MLSLQSKSVEGRCGTHHDGAKPLEGVHFWRPNVAKVCKGAAVPTTMASNHWKVFTFGVEMEQKSWKVLHKGCRGKENVGKVLEGSTKVMEMRCQK